MRILMSLLIAVCLLASGNAYARPGNADAKYATWDEVCNIPSPWITEDTTVVDDSNTLSNCTIRLSEGVTLTIKESNLTLLSENNNAELYLSGDHDDSVLVVMDSSFSVQGEIDIQVDGGIDILDGSAFSVESGNIFFFSWAGDVLIKDSSLYAVVDQRTYYEGFGIHIELNGEDITVLDSEFDVECGDRSECGVHIPLNHGTINFAESKVDIDDGDLIMETVEGDAIIRENVFNINHGSLTVKADEGTIIMKTN